MTISRDNYLKKLKDRYENGLIKIITGIKGCGKSYLLNVLFYDQLIKEGVPNDHIIRFAFDSADDLLSIEEDFEQINSNQKKVNARKFMSYIQARTKDNGLYYLLLDEVQNLDCFEMVLNDYLRRNNMDIYVTGSNSKFLSSDVLTEFRGRGDEIQVLPLAFHEFYASYPKDKDYALDDYMIYGGLPCHHRYENR